MAHLANNMAESQNGGDGHQWAQNTHNNTELEIREIHLNLQISNHSIQEQSMGNAFQRATKPPIGALSVGLNGGAIS